MSTTITTAFVKQYEREVHEAFQRKQSHLLMTIRRKPNVRGTTTTFQKLGKGKATTKSRHGLVTPMNAQHTNVSVTMVDFYAPEYVDKLDELKINHDERRIQANAGAFALGRKIDEQIVTALDGTSNTEAHASTGLTKAKIQSAFETLADNDVFESGRVWFVTEPNGWNDLLNITEFASSDYVGGNYPWLDGKEAKRWMGINFMMSTALVDV